MPESFQHRNGGSAIIFLLPRSIPALIAKCNPEEMTDAQVADLKAAQEKLMTSAQKLFAKLYEQQGGAAGAGAGTAGAGPDMGNAGAAGGHDDDVVDADYKEV